MTVLKRCHWLNNQSTRCAAVLGAWANQEGLISRGKVIASIKARKSHSKQTTVANVYIDVDDTNDAE